MASLEEHLNKRVQAREQEKKSKIEEKEEEEKNAELQGIYTEITSLEQEINELETVTSSLPELYSNTSESVKEFDARFKELEQYFDDPAKSAVLREEMGITEVKQLFGEDELFSDDKTIRDKAVANAQEYNEKRNIILKRLLKGSGKGEGLSKHDKKVVGVLIKGKIKDIMSALEARTVEKKEVRDKLVAKTPEGKKKIQDSIKEEISKHHDDSQMLMDNLDSFNLRRVNRNRIVDISDVEQSKKIENGGSFVLDTLYEFYKEQITKEFEKKQEHAGITATLEELAGLPNYDKEKADLVDIWNETKRECKLTLKVFKDTISGSKDIEKQVRKYFSDYHDYNAPDDISSAMFKDIFESSTSYDSRVSSGKITPETYLDEVVDRERAYRSNARDTIVESGRYEDIASVTKMVNRMKDWVINLRTAFKENPKFFTEDPNINFKDLAQVSRSNKIPEKSVSGRLREVVTDQGSLENAKKILEEKLSNIEKERDLVIKQMKHQLDADWDNQCYKIHRMVNDRDLAVIEDRVKNVEQALSAIGSLENTFGDVGKKKGNFLFDKSGYIDGSSSIKEGKTEYTRSEAYQKIQELEKKIKDVEFRLAVNANKTSIIPWKKTGIKQEREVLQVEKNTDENEKKTWTERYAYFDTIQKNLRKYMQQNRSDGCSFQSSVAEFLIDERGRLEKLKKHDGDLSVMGVLKVEERLKSKSETSENKFKEFLEKRLKG
ncbi:MAG: hypothetical protein Q8P11_02785 [bacterium]|nr:hypothetical protein [bacterium]